MIRTIIRTRITTLRQAKGWTKKQLALKADISVTYIGELEAGKKNPTIVIIEKIANALEVEISELFKEEII
ncbi:MAG: helix-turn-helix transcriptional regulator [Maledivibacter sp.]|jgi:transcriptional regulator with XRE-family HTH domain|nr:helix-turn-helix transcriptional regulator [Maledivibacter sp.]